jgi:hypothetical protein
VRPIRPLSRVHLMVRLKSLLGGARRQEILGSILFAWLRAVDVGRMPHTISLPNLHDRRPSDSLTFILNKYALVMRLPAHHCARLKHVKSRAERAWSRFKKALLLENEVMLGRRG